jgi:hypothetical protein
MISRDTATRRSMSLAAIHYASGFLIDDFVGTIVAQLRAEGFSVGGVVQENSGKGACTVMTLVDVATAARFDISQDLGALAASCRLDPCGLANAGFGVEQAIDEAVDILVINKFGKAEAEIGGGLRTTFAHAIALGIPVLTAVRPPHDQAWAQFHDGLAVDLPAEIDPVFVWCCGAIRERRAAAPLVAAAGP